MFWVWRCCSWLLWLLLVWTSLDHLPPDPPLPSAGPPNISLFFFPFPPPFRSFCVSLALNFGGVQNARTLNAHIWALGLSCETPAAPPDRAAGARTQQPENSKRAHLRAPAIQNTTTREDPQRDTETAKWWREREEKARNFELPTLRGPTLRGPHPSGPHPSGSCPHLAKPHLAKTAFGQFWCFSVLAKFSVVVVVACCCCCCFSWLLLLLLLLLVVVVIVVPGCCLLLPVGACFGGRIHFHPKSISSTDTFIQTRFHPKHFHPILTLSSNDTFNQDSFIQQQFHPMNFSSNDIFIQ